MSVAATLTAQSPALASPSLQLERTIRTSPFVGTSVSIKDGEGTADVPRDGSLWLVDDNGRAIHEVNPSTGALKRTIDRAAFEAAPRFGGGPVAGPSRSGDLESAAYDPVQDQLFIFSGPCCTSSNLPTVFRLTRTGGALQVESYQPLASGSNHTAAAWNPADQKIYVGLGSTLRTFDYPTNTLGQISRVTGLSGILGLDFSSRDGDLFAVTNAEKLVRVDWATRTIVPGWTFDLAPSGVRDSRGVSVILGSSADDDRYYVLDGGDTRSAGDPLRHAVYVFKVIDGGGGPPPPSGNLVGNPDFEADTAGWSTAGSGTGVTLARSSSAHTGSWAAHVANGSTGTRKCVLNDTPNWVTTTQPGTYTARMWVRADSPGATIKITLKEMDGSTVVRSRIFSAPLTTSWDLIAVEETTWSPGTTLDLQVFIPKAQAPPGTCFYGDDVSITLS